MVKMISSAVSFVSIQLAYSKKAVVMTMSLMNKKFQTRASMKYKLL